MLSKSGLNNLLQLNQYFRYQNEPPEAFGSEADYILRMVLLQIQGGGRSIIPARSCNDCCRLTTLLPEGGMTSGVGRSPTII
jgi:hypothetical protein